MAQPTSSRRRASTGVGVDVGQDGETLLHQQAGRLQGANRVGEQVLGVRDDFQLHKVGLGYFTAQAGDEQGFLDGGAAGGVGQDVVLAPVDVVEDGLLGGVVKVKAADGDGNHLGAGSGDGVHHVFVGAVAAGADYQAGRETLAPNYQVIGHCCNSL